jgi:glutamate/tyrosine decarboxylase-like PLP-dependent enzyme
MMHRMFYARDLKFYQLFAQSVDTALGVVCSGGTIANITAMWLARNKALSANPDLGIEGISKIGLVKSMKLHGYEGAVIIGSELMHYSFRKAVDLLGLGEDGICLIPSDDKFQMRVALLREKVREFKINNILIIAIVCIAGTTETYVPYFHLNDTLVYI